MLKIENNQKDNYIYEILENISRSQREALDILNGFEIKNLSIDKKSYDAKRLILISMLWGTYIGTIGSLQEKNITKDDLIFLNEVSNVNKNNKINEELNNFNLIIKSFTDLYLNMNNMNNQNNYKIIIEPIKPVEESNDNIINNKIINDKINNKNQNDDFYLLGNNNVENNDNLLISNKDEKNIIINDNNPINLINNNNIKSVDNEKGNKINDNNNIIKEAKKQKVSTCIFCIEEFDEDEIVNPLLECNKHVHGKCFADYIENELNNNHFPIKCPLCSNKERHEINYKTISDCLILNDKEKTVIKLENISLNRLSETNPDEISFCPTPGCQYICYYDANVYHLDCPLCKKSYCLKCKTEWHKNQTCQEYQEFHNMTYDEKINQKKFDDYVKGNKCKQCPTCKRWIEKNKGCDHISCLCGTHFCYRCGEVRDSKNPYNHRCPDKPRYGISNLVHFNINDRRDRRNNNRNNINNLFNDFNYHDNIRTNFNGNNTFNFNNNYNNNINIPPLSNNFNNNFINPPIYNNNFINPPIYNNNINTNMNNLPFNNNINNNNYNSIFNNNINNNMNNSPFSNNTNLQNGNNMNNLPFNNNQNNNINNINYINSPFNNNSNIRFNNNLNNNNYGFTSNLNTNTTFNYNNNFINNNIQNSNFPNMNNQINMSNQINMNNQNNANNQFNMNNQNNANNQFNMDNQNNMNNQFNMNNQNNVNNQINMNNQNNVNNQINMNNQNNVNNQFNIDNQININNQINMNNSESNKNRADDSRINEDNKGNNQNQIKE